MVTDTQFQRIISADSHVMEPEDLWWNALGHKFGDRTPRRVENYRGQGKAAFYHGRKGAEASELREEAAMEQAEEHGLEACGYDPAVRVRFQMEAGVEAEVLNSTLMLSVMTNPDAELVRASTQVFNDWLIEFVSHDPQRLVGVGMAPMHDADWAANEMERTLKAGLRGFMINTQPPEGCPPYRDHVYDRFWAAAEEAGAPVLLHILTGRAVEPIGLAFCRDQTEEERGANPGLWADMIHEIQTVLANDFIFGGILDRFPRLKVLCTEYELAWVLGFAKLLEQIRGFDYIMGVPKLQMAPVDYLRTRIYHGFIDDVYAQYAIPHVGAERVLWGSDFPHIRSIGLEAHDTVSRLLSALPQADQEKVVGLNAASVFNVN